MAESNLFGGLTGGLLIGLAAALLLLINGRIAGISGIVGGFMDSNLAAWPAAPAGHAVCPGDYRRTMAGGAFNLR